MKKFNKQVIAVTSGAVGIGRSKLGLPTIPKRMEDRRVCAATGQSSLMTAWNEAFDNCSVKSAQILLMLDDTEIRHRWLDVRTTLWRMRDLGICPIINENDSISEGDLRYGSNDILAARIAQMVQANVLIFLSDVDGLYDANPRTSPDARLIPLVESITPEIEAIAGEAGSAHGTGGMASKINAARDAMNAGCTVVICRPSVDGFVDMIESGERLTVLKASTTLRTARKQWIMGTLRTQGTIVVDQGAAKAILSGKSLLSAGVVSIAGDFSRGDAVLVCDESGSSICKGLASYASHELAKVVRTSSRQFRDLLGYDMPSACVHRNDLVVIRSK